MKQVQSKISVSTRCRGIYSVSSEVCNWVSQQDIQSGLLTIFVSHTSASLLIQENADSDVLEDLNRFFNRLVPDGDPLFMHQAEGPDDMPAHVRSALTQTHLSIPVHKNKPRLGIWQGIYLFEHRIHPFKREILLHLIGE